MKFKYIVVSILFMVMLYPLSVFADQTYTITFYDMDGQTVLSSQEYDVGTSCISIEWPDNYNKENIGYLHVGWYTDKNLTSLFDFKCEIDYDIDLYGRWVNMSDWIWTITFDANGGSGSMQPYDYRVHESITLPKNLYEREGYVFTGWNTLSNGEGISYSDREALESPDSTMTLYAQWSELPKYTVTFYDIDGETILDSKQYYEGTSYNSIEWPDNYDKENIGYLFEWWYMDKNLTSRFDSSDVLSDNINLYGHWVDDGDWIWTITFDANGGSGSMQPYEYRYHESIILPKNLYEREGYVFTGWNTLSNGKGISYSDQEALESPDITITLYAQWMKKPGVIYTTHVQNIGWQSYVTNGEMSGTSGKSLRLEGIKINLTDQPYDGSILYRTHIESIGWESGFKKDNEMSGTSGRSLRLEAIEIKLDGEMADYYDVYYRVHAQDVGWMNWAKNGEQSGTSGYGRRLEAIEIVLVEKGLNPPNRNDLKTDKAYLSKTVKYSTHIQDIGWQGEKADGEMSGTSHQSKRLEGIKISLRNVTNGGIEYRTHVQDYGWMDYVSNGAMSGTSHESKRLEAIQIRLTGEYANTHDVYYRVHAQNVGWMNWAKNGEKSGTAHYSYRLEAIEIVLVDKGEAPPIRTDIKTTQAFIDKNS